MPVVVIYKEEVDEVFFFENIEYAIQISKGFYIKAF